MPHQITLALLIIVSLLLPACATTPQSPANNFVAPVYPPPPAAPRFVYERTLLYSDDVEEYTKAQRFREFATGASHKLRGLAKPFDVVAHQGRVYVSDTVQRAVILFDIPGKRYVEIGTDKPGELIKPLGLTLSSRNELFVTDSSAQRIMVYDADGQFLRAIGNKIQLHRPSDVTVSPDGLRLYVVDTGGVDSAAHHVHIYDAISGDYIKKIASRGSGAGELNLPLQAAVSSDGTLFVVDAGNFRVQSFTAEGQYLSSFGTVGRQPGQFARPKGIAIDADDHLYVVDTAFGNVQIFNRDGQLLMHLGERGNAGYPGKYMLPSGIDIDEQGRIYLVDQFFRKIDIFRPVGLTDTATDK